MRNFGCYGISIVTFLFVYFLVELLCSYHLMLQNKNKTQNIPKSAVEPPLGGHFPFAYKIKLVSCSISKHYFRQILGSNVPFENWWPSEGVSPRL